MIDQTGRFNPRKEMGKKKWDSGTKTYKKDVYVCVQVFVLKRHRIKSNLKKKIIQKGKQKMPDSVHCIWNEERLPSKQNHSSNYTNHCSLPTWFGLCSDRQKTNRMSSWSTWTVNVMLRLTEQCPSCYTQNSRMLKVIYSNKKTLHCSMWINTPKIIQKCNCLE